jgi:NAD(P)-dependent dehydrogenase (short-subunit alcohol dehydrogenase family)
MTERAALVTGASSGIGLAIAHVLGEAGYALTVTSRRPEKLAAAAAELRSRNYEVADIDANVANHAEIAAVVAHHREVYGRLDVLINNAGMGIAGPFQDLLPKWIDLQLAVALRSVILFYQEALSMLKEAGAEHGNALVVNMSSITGKYGEAQLAVYSAAKHGIVGFTESMNGELKDAGVKSCALCPGFVDTSLSDFIKHEIPAEAMIRCEDIAEAVRFLLRLSAQCVVPEIMFMRPGDRL